MNPCLNRAPRASGPEDTRLKAPAARVPEPVVWASLDGAWRVLYGGFNDYGVSIETHEFSLAKAFDWGRSFHPGSLEVCLNISGKGVVHGTEGFMEFGAGTVGFYLPGEAGSRAMRLPGAEHRFLTLEFSRGYLRQHLRDCDGALDPLVERIISGDTHRSALGQVRRLTPEQERGAAQLIHPPVAQGARALWYSGKVRQLMADLFFTQPEEEELFCDRQKRLARERAERVIALLRRNLVEPLSLGALSREVGCSPFYLSRTFSQQTGLTIPQYLRKLRMERAAELLRSGRYNVTEAALEVGYSSLSHFSQAFCQTMGCCPVLYPARPEVNGGAPQPTVK